MKRILSIALALLFIVCMMSGCNEGGAGMDSGETVVSVNDTLNVVVRDDANQFSPYITNSFSDIMSIYQIYERLVEIKNGDVVPGLASSWEVSEDGLTITFHLREGATFHNGAECSSEDVLYSFEKQMENSSSLKSKIDSISAPDEQTVIIKTPYPCASIFNSLSTPGTSIVCKSYVEEQGDDAFIHPVGSGAYQLKEWVKGSKICFEAYEDYNGEKAKIKYLNFNIISDTSTALVAMENGNDDFMIGAAASDASLIEANDNLVMETAPSHSMAQLYLNLQQGIFTNEKLRQAVACAIDREAINISAFEGTGQIAKGCFDDFLCYDGKDYTYAYDLDRAKALLAEAGYPDGGFAFTIKTADVYGDVVPQIIMENLKQVGIEVKIEVLEIGAHSQDWLNANYEVIYSAGSSITPDLSESLYGEYYSDNVWSPSAQDDGRFDERLDEMRYTVDNTQKTELACSILADILAEAGEIPLIVQTTNIVYQKGLQVTQIDPNGMFYQFKDFSWND